MWTPEQEEEAKRLLEKLRQKPFAKELEELGKMLMRPRNSLTLNEEKRLFELQEFLAKNMSHEKPESLQEKIQSNHEHEDYLNREITLIDKQIKKLEGQKRKLAKKVSKTMKHRNFLISLLSK